MKFKPFEHTKPNNRGAQMGRASSEISHYDGESALFSQHCGGTQGYDKGGAYWGHSKVFAVYTRDGEFCVYIEASNRKEAINIVKNYEYE